MKKSFFGRKISVIIPAYNEQDHLPSLINMLFRYGGEFLAEVIVADGCSSDATIQAAQNASARIIHSPERSRAAQMNCGASYATGDILYFVHADVKIHPDFTADILHAVSHGADMGCYRFKFDSKKWPLKINAWFTRLPFIWCRGGDQTLFVKKDVFHALGGFRSNYRIMEDYDFIKRAKDSYHFYIIPKNVVVSARKYERNSYLQVQRANYTIMRMWRNGASQEDMVNRYNEMLNDR